jgi:nicotinate (nicotinamide) nucleotide adenylyltransferase
MMTPNPLSPPVRFFRGTALHSGRLGIFPGAFNPPTRAHLALAQAARDQHGLQQVAFLLPRAFPHKAYSGASFDQRVAMLEDALASDPGLAVATSEGGLVIEIVRSFQAVCGDGVEIYVLCGQDAAERFADWDYGDLPLFSEQLRQFQMLVASREREYIVPREYAGRIHSVKIPPGYDEDSSFAVREAMDTGRPWGHLVPENVARQIREKGLYKRGSRGDDE